MDYNRMLDGQVAIVTGTRKPRGFGAAITRLFLSQGAKVAMINRGDAEAVLPCLKDLGEVENFVADLSKDDEVESAVADIVDRFGGINVIVNNAGTADFDTNIVSNMDVWDEVFSAKVRGAQILLNRCWPHVQQGGRIVNIASLAGRFGAAMAAPSYTAANAALVGLTKDWAKKAAKAKKVRCNVIAPGPGLTDMLADADPEKLAGMKANSLLGDICSPEDIANIALFYASDMSRMITGTCQDSNGGMWIPS